MSSEELRKSQRDVFATIQQLRSQPSAMNAAVNSLMAQLEGAAIAPASEGGIVQGEQHLVFSLGDYEFAVKAEHVQIVERLGELTALPNIAPWIKGVINLRGSIVSVVDLRGFLDLEPRPSTARTRLLCLQCNDMVICCVVDGVNEMLAIPANAIVKGNARQATLPRIGGQGEPGWAAPYTAGSAVLAGNRVLVLLDVARLLFSEKMQHYEALG